MLIRTLWFMSMRGKRVVSMLMEDGTVVKGVLEAEICDVWHIEDIDDLVGEDVVLRSDPEGSWVNYKGISIQI